MTIALLLPGMDGTGRSRRAFVDALVPGIDARIVSYPTRELLGYSALESLVRAELPNDRPYVIIAESFSGPIAISIAASRPAGLAGLVLCCTFAKNPRPSLRFLRPLIDWFPIATAPILASRLLFGSFSTPNLQSELRDVLKSVAIDTLRARMREVLLVDVVDRLSSIEVPCLYLRATHDRLVPEFSSSLLTARLQHVRMIEINGPHFLLQTLPKESARAVNEFLIELDLPQDDA